MWKCKPGWFCTQSNDGIKLFSDTQAFHVKIPKELSSVLFESGSLLLSEDHEGCSSIIQELDALGVITNEDSSSKRWSESLQSQYFYHIGIDPEKALTILNTVHVLILGLGGTGAIILDHLVSAGIKNYTLVDDGYVSQSNLERQLIYETSSVGKLKTDEAEKRVLSKSENAQVFTIQKRVEWPEDLEEILNNIRKVDFCVVCIDHPPRTAFSTASQVLWVHNIPFIHGGVMANSGFWGPLFSKEHNSPYPEGFDIWGLQEDNMPEPEPTKICFSPYNTITASHMSADILHFLIGAYKLVNYKARTFNNLRNLKYDPISSKDSTSK